MKLIVGNEVIVIPQLCSQQRGGPQCCLFCVSMTMDSSAACLQWTHQLADNPDLIIILKVRLRHKTTLGLEDCVSPVGNIANAPVEQQQDFGDENPLGHLQAGIDSDSE